MFVILAILFTMELSAGDDNHRPVASSLDSTVISVPLGGNSWVTHAVPDGSEEVTDEGWKGWNDPQAVFSTFVKLRASGTLNISAVVRVPQGNSTIRCSINAVPAVAMVSGTEWKEYPLGGWIIKDTGYVRIDMKGISRSGPFFAEISELRISGSAVGLNSAFVKNNEGNYFYWGRRGPSVHLNFDSSEVGNDAEWFYSEITVPAGNDVTGSYFMANGFKEGYFGIQVNSTTERRVLFSVWSPYRTDDPASVPDDKKILLIKKGKNVHTGEFGNEGSGGQSYLVYPWKSDTTYRFLLHAQPLRDEQTVFTAYFFAPERKQWMLIASFSRPATKTYLTRLHSFLENFEPTTGWITRKALYGNQWIRNTLGEWKPLSVITFTADATAQKGYRLDYEGGSTGTKFFLRNCGFFNQQTLFRTTFSRTVTNPPSIDLLTME